jgi:hypothetical protein
MQRCLLAKLFPVAVNPGVNFGYQIVVSPGLEQVFITPQKHQVFFHQFAFSGDPGVYKLAINIFF